MKLIHVAALICGALALRSSCGAQDAAASFQAQVLPLLKANCTECHGAAKQKAKINLDGSRTLEKLTADRTLWYQVLDQLEAGTMPPEDAEKHPTPVERQAIIQWIRGDFTDLMADNQHKKEGRARLRRLSRNEYANTFEDLFGFRPNVDNLPTDMRVEGYDRISAAVPLSADGSLGYLTNADELLNKWVLRPQPKPPAPPAGAPAPAPTGEASRTVHAEARPSEQSKGHILELPDGTMVSFNTDNTSGPVKYPGSKVPGIHKVRVSVYGYQTDKPLPFGIYAGNTWAYPQSLELVRVLEAPPGKAAVVETELYLNAGVGMRLIPFGLGVPVPKNNQASACRAPGLAVQWLEDVEPEQPLLADHWLTADFPKAVSDEIRATYGNIKIKNSKSTNRAAFLGILQATLKRVGPRLFRRELTPDEVNLSMTEAGRQLDAGTSLGPVFNAMIVDLLTSPDFFCVIEQPGPLNDFALASRLSYFLWNSRPDEKLFELARAGKLKDPKVLQAETERMLKDPKSSRFTDDFASQWLGLYAINDTSPDGNLYPGYGDLLKYSSVLETKAYFRAMVDENLGAKFVVESPWVLANHELSVHYGLPEVAGQPLQKVKLPDGSPFGGLWSQSAVMKVTANGTNTSPVKRGVWVAKRLLGNNIPPPPPNIKPLEPDTRGAKTLREQLALHSSGGSCTSCHARFDPFGFALESFDVRGDFRKFYREANAEVLALPQHERAGKQTWKDGLPVDCSGKTPDGKAFANLFELRQQLSANPEPLARGLVHHLLTYATGTPAGPLDEKAVDEIVKKSAADGYGARALINALIQSEVFRYK